MKLPKSRIASGRGHRLCAAKGGRGRRLCVTPFGNPVWGRISGRVNDVGTSFTRLEFFSKRVVIKPTLNARVKGAREHRLCALPPCGAWGRGRRLCAEPHFGRIGFLP